MLHYITESGENSQSLVIYELDNITQVQPQKVVEYCEIITINKLLVNICMSLLIYLN